MSQLNVNTIKNRTGTSGPVLTGLSTVSGSLVVSNDATVSGAATVTGALTAASGSFTGNVSVGGTLTYEDVTNIDSVGVVTARQGIVVVGGGITAVGVVTATKFIGDGSELSGVVSGIEVKSNGTSVGTSLTAINFVHTGDITTGSGGITTVTTWEVFDTWLYGGG
jgi:hypothetical protein